MEVFSFGNGDFLFQIFTAIKGVMADNSFGTLIRISVLFGFLIVMYQLFFSMNITTISLGVIKQYLIVAIIFYALFVPKSDVVIRDEINNTNVSVTAMPLGVSLFAHTFTSIEKGITEIMETYFTTPNDMKFSKSGYAFSIMLLDTMKSATPVDPYFKRTLNDYVVNCFFHDVLWGDKDLNSIIYSNTLFADMAPAHSATIYTKTYDATYPQGQATVCSNAYSTLQGQIATATTNTLTKLNQTMQQDVTAKLPVVVQSWLNVSQNATDLIGQSFAANAMKTGLAETAMYTGISADAVAYASAMAEQTQRSQWAIAGELAKKYIPIMRQVLEAFVYGLFPILFILMLSPIGTKMLHMYFILLVWLLLWSPLFAIVNLILNVRTTGVLASAYGYYSIGTMPYIYETTNDITALAGYLAWMVPTLAFAIAKGSDYAMVSIASGIQSSTSLTTHQASQGITGVDGATKTAAAAGQFQAAQAFGSSSFADATAASSFFNMASGTAMHGLGESHMTRMASNVIKNSDFEAEVNSRKIDKLNSTVNNAPEKIAAGRALSELKSSGAAEAYGGDLSISIGTASKQEGSTIGKYGAYSSSQEAARAYGVAENVFKGAQQGYEQAAALFKMSPQELSSALTQLDTGNKAQFVQRFADKNKLFFEDGARSLAALTGDRSYADIHSFVGEKSQAGGIEEVSELKKAEGQIHTAAVQGQVDGAGGVQQAASTVKTGSAGDIHRTQTSIDQAGGEVGYRDVKGAEGKIQTAGVQGQVEGAGGVDKAASTVKTGAAGDIHKTQASVDQAGGTEEYKDVKGAEGKIQTAGVQGQVEGAGGIDKAVATTKTSAAGDIHKTQASVDQAGGIEQYKDVKGAEGKIQTAGVQGQVEGAGGIDKAAAITKTGAAGDIHKTQTSIAQAGGEAGYRDVKGAEGKIQMAGVQGQVEGAGESGSTFNADGFRRLAKIETGAKFDLLSTLDKSKITDDQYAHATNINNNAKKLSIADLIRSGDYSMDEARMIQKAGLLTEKGQAKAAENLAQLNASVQGREVRASDISDAREYLSTNQGKLDYARFSEMDKFADKRGQSLFSLMQDSSRSINLSVGEKQAKRWGLPGKGNFMISWGNDGNFVFTKREAGKQSTVGIISWSGSSIKSEQSNTWDSKTGPASPEAMWNAAMTKDSTPGRRISGATTKAQKIKEETQQAQAFSEALTARVSSQGITVSYSAAEGKIGASSSGRMGAGGVDSVGIGVGMQLAGSASIGGRNIEQHNFNIYNGITRGIQRERDINAQKYGNDYADRIYTDRLHALAKANDELISGKSEASFGISSTFKPAVGTVEKKVEANAKRDSSGHGYSGSF